MDNIVRIESITIQNFKNIKNGYLSFENSKKNYAASILGLYGQNGSGKTALIDALELLRLALSGKSLPPHFANFINVDSESATIKYALKVQSDKYKSAYDVVYELSLKREIDDSDQNMDNPSTNENYKAIIVDEILSYSYEPEIGKRERFATIIDTRTENDKPFVPAAKYHVLVGKSKETLTNLMVAKQLSRATSRSFIFSKELVNIIRQKCQKDYHRHLIDRMMVFGNYELFVINTSNTGLISMDALPLSFRYSENGKATVGNMQLKLNEPTLISEQALGIVKKVVANMNIVLQQIVPGLTIGVRELGTQLNSNGSLVCRVQLISKKNSKEIPLKYESEGIKKIVSILQLLIVVYNKASITVAIDELDSGVFEYLLGEILRIISEKGKGQLIFTSHNLRPLETIDKGFIAFTTTNPDNRYIRMTNVKSSNNLRDFYYRDIILGEQDEPVYDTTNNYEIALAFREAGASYAT